MAQRRPFSIYYNPQNPFGMVTTIQTGGEIESIGGRGSLREKIMEKLRETAENTTSHAIPNIARSRNWFIKIMWLLFFLGSLSYCLYTIIQSITSYLQYQTNIQIDIQRVTIDDFPAVTICNVNSFNNNPTTTDYLNQKLKDGGLQDAIDLVDETNSLKQAEALENLKKYYNTNNTLLIMEYILDFLRGAIIADNLPNDVRSGLSVSLDNMLLSCSYNRKDCGPGNFSQFWHYKHGNCYIFNGDKTVSSPQQTSQAGSSHGLQLELYANDPSLYIKYSSSFGVYLLVHNYSTNPLLFPDLNNIAAGFETYVAVSRTYRYILSSPYSDCQNSLKPFNSYSTTLFGYMSSLNITEYNQQFCYKLCYQDQAISQCNCADAQIPTIKGAKYCQNKTELDCLKQMEINFQDNSLDSICGPACPIECNTITYSQVDHTSNYPSQYYVNLIKSEVSGAENITDETQLTDYLRNSILKLTVNYDDLSYTTIQDQASTQIEDLLGNIGGQLGLFIGISVLTFVELFELAIELGILIYRHKKGL